MIDIFLKEDINKLVKNKFIVFMGDSNTRAMYKDFLCLLNQSQLISDEKLRKKMEPSAFGDKLVFHGEKSNGRNYREEREYCNNGTQVSFFFLTHVYDKYVKEVLRIIDSKRKPDVLVVNSCLWDVTRWGTQGVEEYQINLQTLLKLMKLQFPDCLVIWVTTPPISAEVKGGFLVNELEFLKYSLRFHVMEANQYARKVVVENGFDLLDTHYHLKMQIHRRSADGIHWLPPAVRYITNLLLTHISLAWNVPLPKRYESSNLNVEEEEEIVVSVKEEEENNQPPQKKKKNQPVPNQGSNRQGPSHHKFMQAEQRKERSRRRKKRRGANSIGNFSPRPFAASSCHNSPINNQHDSGYFASPSEASLSNEAYHINRRNITFGSPLQVQSYGYARNVEVFANPRMSQEFYGHGRQTYQPYNVQDIPLPSEPYPPYRVQNNPFTPVAYQSSLQISPLPFHLQNRGQLLPEPYSFPYVAQGQILRPHIDFTSDDFMAY